MSCNGCRVLRKGCSENCILRPCLQWIESPQAQAHATVFVAKFFGRAGLMSFISSVPDKQRPALFQSLLFEACGRTVNPVNGAVGLLWTGNWHVCQAAVQTVLRGRALCPVPEFLSGATLDLNDTSEAEINRISDTYEDSNCDNRDSNPKRRRIDVLASKDRLSNLGLSLTPCSTSSPKKQRRCGTPSMNSEEESGTTTCSESGDGDQEPKLLKLFT